MLSYGDLMTLLLCCFVLLFACSSLDVVKFRKALTSLQSAFGILPGGMSVMSSVELPEPRPEAEQLSSARGKEARFAELAAKIKKRLEAVGAENKVSLVLERGLVIRFVDSVLFDLGQATLRPEGAVLLEAISGPLAEAGNPIRVEGHTCDLPVRPGGQFESNWDLSAARAITVVRYFIHSAGITPDRLSAVGYGEYKPLVPNTSERNRARNRRVDIVVMSETGQG